MSIYRHLAAAGICEESVIYAGGGGGLVLVPSHRADDVERILENILAEETHGDLRSATAALEIWPRNLDPVPADPTEGLDEIFGMPPASSRYAVTVSGVMSYAESPAGEIVVSGEAWAGDGAQISLNGGLIDPLTLSWSEPAADGRRHTEFSATLPVPEADGAFGLIARVTELDDRYAQARRLLFRDASPPSVVEMFPADGSSAWTATRCCWSCSTSRSCTRPWKPPTV